MQRSLIVLAMLVSSLANAAPVTWEFGGVINDVTDPYGLLTFDVALGDAYSGSFTFDDATLDSNPDPMIGTYYGLIASTFTVGNYSRSFTFDPTASRVYALNRTTDTFGIQAWSTLDPIPGAEVVELYMFDRSGAALTSDTLPQDPASLSVFPIRSFGYMTRGLDPQTQFGVFSGSIDSIRAVRQVPEPGVLALVAFGAVGFAVARRRNIA